MDISIPESLVGYQRQIKMPDGVTVVIRHRGITNPNNDNVLIVPGYGVPYIDNPTKRGDLFIKPSVFYPPEFSEYMQQKIWKFFMDEDQFKFEDVKFDDNTILCNVLSTSDYNSPIILKKSDPMNDDFDDNEEDIPE